MGEARIDLHIDELDVPADPAKRLGLILHELVAQDNGPGFPEKPHLFRKGSMGLSLVESLAKELGATVEKKNRAGARVTVCGPLKSLSADS